MHAESAASAPALLDACHGQQSCGTACLCKERDAPELVLAELQVPEIGQSAEVLGQGAAGQAGVSDSGLQLADSQQTLHGRPAARLQQTAQRGLMS